MWEVSICARQNANKNAAASSSGTFVFKIAMTSAWKRRKKASHVDHCHFGCMVNSCRDSSGNLCSTIYPVNSWFLQQLHNVQPLRYRTHNRWAIQLWLLALIYYHYGFSRIYHLVVTRYGRFLKILKYSIGVVSWSHQLTFWNISPYGLQITRARESVQIRAHKSVKLRSRDDQSQSYVMLFSKILKKNEVVHYDLLVLTICYTLREFHQ